jgi:hypothetical protein
MMENFVDRTNADEAGHIDTLISRFVYRTGIPFRVVDSNAFQELIKALRPAYFKTKPPTSNILTAYGVQQSERNWRPTCIELLNVLHHFGWMVEFA